MAMISDPLSVKLSSIFLLIYSDAKGYLKMKDIERGFGSNTSPRLRVSNRRPWAGYIYRR
jgi:hypothetical protein